MAEGLPTGTLTFLFTDVEGSTRTLTAIGADNYAAALEEHNRLIREAVAAHDGIEVDTQGDAFFCVFTSARDAIACARDAQQQLAATSIRVRMGLHSGEALVVDDHYVGLDVHRAARVAAAAHGGQVLLSPTTLALLEPGSFELRDLGEHRLKDLSAPVRLHQLDGADFPPLKTLHRTNLPLPATPFLGRRREVDELKAIDGHRLLTLTGPGGSGKTRLALQVAAELADDFPGGVFWVPLAPLREEAVVPAAVAAVFEAEDVASVGSEISQSTLLLVDNCEHVLDESARVVAALMRATDKLRVLATSREPLSIAGERVVPVDPLDPSDAVDLFHARAEAAGAADLDPTAVRELCARLDDLPLAIELAAARTPAFPPGVLLERLSGHVDLLHGTRDADDRQRTLAATIGWSYDLLSAEEQRVFRNLSVFVGGAGLEAVEYVAQASIDDIASLVAKSLVRMTPGSDGPRYWMLETIREFGNGRLGDEERAPLEQRLVEFGTQLAVTAAPQLGEKEAVKWLDRLEADVGNLRLAFAIARGLPGESSAQIAAALGDLHTVHGRYAEAQEVVTAALPRADDPLLGARLLRLLGEVHVRRQDFTAAAAAYAQGLDLLGSPSNGDPAWWREWVDLKLQQATLHYWKADTAALHSAAETLGPYVEEHGTPRQRANFIMTRVFDLLRRDRYTASPEAEELARAYVGAAEDAGDWDGGFMLGFVLLWRSKFAEALEHLRRGREVAIGAGDVLTEIRCLIYQAVAHRRLGDVVSVRGLAAETAEFDNDYGYAGLIAANRAWLAWRDGDLDAVEQHAATAIADWPPGMRAGPTVFQWTARFPLLAVHLERGRLEDAVEQAQAMLDHRQQQLRPDVREALEAALVEPSPSSFEPVLELARAAGYV